MNQTQNTVNIHSDKPAAPTIQLKSNRSLLKVILLSIITLGIYFIVFYSSLSTDMNTIAGRYDGKRTMHYCLLFFIVGSLTLGIGYLVWYHKLSARIGKELKRRGSSYYFSATSYWLWNILGSLILIGPFIYLYQLCTAMNLLTDNFNSCG